MGILHPRLAFAKFSAGRSGRQSTSRQIFPWILGNRPSDRGPSPKSLTP